MRLETNGVYIMDGEIRKIRFNNTQESASLTISGKHDITVEFANAKQRRADHVKKLQLNVGEHVILVGSMSKGSNCLMYGYDIQRSGKVSAGNYVLLKGEVMNLQKMSRSTIITLCYEKSKCVTIKVPKFVISKPVQKGDTAAFLCYRKGIETCQKECGNWSYSKCQACMKKSKSYRYDALDMACCA